MSGRSGWNRQAAEIALRKTVHVDHEAADQPCTAELCTTPQAAAQGKLDASQRFGKRGISNFARRVFCLHIFQNTARSPRLPQRRHKASPARRRCIHTLHSLVRRRGTAREAPTPSALRSFQKLGPTLSTLAAPVLGPRWRRPRVPGKCCHLPVCGPRVRLAWEIGIRDGGHAAVRHSVSRLYQGRCVCVRACTCAYVDACMCVCVCESSYSVVHALDSLARDSVE